MIPQPDPVEHGPWHGDHPLDVLHETTEALKAVKDLVVAAKADALCHVDSHGLACLLHMLAQRYEASYEALLTTRRLESQSRPRPAPPAQA
jgi:hypothetical protein